MYDIIYDWLKLYVYYAVSDILFLREAWQTNYDDPELMSSIIYNKIKINKRHKAKYCVRY